MLSTADCPLATDDDIRDPAQLCHWLENRFAFCGLPPSRWLMARGMAAAVRAVQNGHEPPKLLRSLVGRGVRDGWEFLTPEQVRMPTTHAQGFRPESEAFKSHEKELLQRIQEGDRDAFDQVTKHRWEMVFCECLVVLDRNIQDAAAAQDTFLRVWKARERLHEIRNFGAWLRLSARGHALKQIEARQRHKEALGVISSMCKAAYRRGYRHVDENDCPECRQVESRDCSELVANGLGELPENQAIAIRLHFIKGLPYRELAAIRKTSHWTQNRLAIQGMARHPLNPPAAWVQWMEEETE